MAATPSPRQSRAGEAAAARRRARRLSAVPSPPATQQQPQDATTAQKAMVAAVIVGGLVQFMRDEQGEQESFMRDQLASRLAPSATAGMISSGSRSISTSDVIDAVIADEREREAVFVARQADRFMRRVTAALGAGAQPERERALRGVMAREEQYLRQRMVAMASRAFAAVDRVVLQQQSPTGAFWQLDPTVREHTAGCLLMGGKFWPWQVLRRVHPPRHAGCPCRLRGYGEAIAEGLMGPGDVPNVRDAVRAAAHVVMEGNVGERDDPELLRDLLFEAWMFDVEDGLVERELATRARLDEIHADVELGLRKPDELRELMEGLGLGRDGRGWFVYAADARSDSFRSPWEIPTSAVTSLKGA